MTGAQCKAARALLGWSIETLAQVSKVGQNTISKFETGKTAPRRSTVTVLRLALETGGIEFIESNGKGEGLRLKTPRDERRADSR